MGKAGFQGGESSAGRMFRKGLATGFPIMLGYLPVAITYGVLAKQSGLSLFELTMMSALVYAGASQFMGVNMIVVSASAMEIIIATFVLNLRHFVMSLSFMNSLRKVKKKWKLPLSLGLTDETFAVSAFHPKEADKKHGAYFYLGIIIIAYLSWVLGSLFGGILGDVIPPNLSQSMGIALYAMFIGLLIPSVKKNMKAGLIAIVAMLVHFIFAGLGLSTGWAIVVGTIFGGICGIFLLEGEKA